MFPISCVRCEQKRASASIKKLCNLLFANGLATRLRAAGVKQPLVIAAHPGVTGIASLFILLRPFYVGRRCQRASCSARRGASAFAAAACRSTRAHCRKFAPPSIRRSTSSPMLRPTKKSSVRARQLESIDLIEIATYSNTHPRRRISDSHSLADARQRQSDRRCAVDAVRDSGQGQV